MVKTFCSLIVMAIVLLSTCSPNAPVQKTWTLSTFDFTSIQQGNVWVFQDSNYVIDYCATPHNYVKTITITKAWKTTGDTTMFTVLVRDSGYLPGNPQPHYLDTSYVETGKKTGDTILLVGDRYYESTNQMPRRGKAT